MGLRFYPISGNPSPRLRATVETTDDTPTVGISIPMQNYNDVQVIAYVTGYRINKGEVPFDGDLCNVIMAASFRHSFSGGFFGTDTAAMVGPVTYLAKHHSSPSTDAWIDLPTVIEALLYVKGKAGQTFRWQIEVEFHGFTNTP